MAISEKTSASRAVLQQIFLSALIAAFVFQLFLSGYSAQFRPRQPVPETGMDHPFNIKGDLVYVTSFESLFLNGFFFWFSALFLVLIILRSFVRYGLQYDVLKQQIRRAPVEDHHEWRRAGVLMAVWLALLLAAWRASL